MRTHSILALIFASAVAGCASAPKPPLANTTSVVPDSEAGRGSRRYRIEGAMGYTESEARTQALSAALRKAAEEAGTSDDEKSRAMAYVRDNIAQLQSFASPGKIYKRAKMDDHWEVNMFVTVRNRDLERELASERIVSKRSKKSKAVGRPTLMVVAREEDCAKNPGQPKCAIEGRIAQAAQAIETTKKDVYAYQDQIVKAGCVDREIVESLVEKSGSASRSSARSGSTYHRGYRGFYRGYYYAPGATVRSGSAASSASASYRYRSVSNQVRNSRNCQSFVSGLNQRERRLAGLEAKLDRLQDEQAKLLEGDATTEVTTTKINQYLVDARLEVIDRDAIRDARRTQQVMAGVSGLPEDPVAAVAQLAGADIYVKFGVTETTAGGGYQVELDAKAYDVVTGKLLASRVEKSKRLADRDRGTAVTQAASKVMPIVLDQVMLYWEEDVVEGALTKVIVRGDLASHRRRVLSALDGVTNGVSGCDDDIDCEFELGLTTAQTLEGSFRVPAKKRRRIGIQVESALQEEGFAVETLVTNAALTMMRIF